LLGKVAEMPGPAPICPVTNPVACDKGTMCRHAARVPNGHRHFNPKIQIEVAPWTPGPEFPFSEDAEMPKVNAWARITGCEPDPSVSVQFKWTAALRYSTKGVRHALPEYSIDHPPMPSQTLGGFEIFSPQFSILQGGELTLSVQAELGKRKLSATTRKLRIVGKNPTLQVISSEIPNNTLRRIALHESTLLQFYSHTNNGSTGRHPHYSHDNLGGVGLFQITYPLKDPKASIEPCIHGKCLPRRCPSHAAHPTPAQIWNWKENVAAAAILLDHKLALAKNYPASVRASEKFKKLVERYNERRTHHDKKPPLTITLPDFTSGDFDNNLQQAELDAIRGYNGWAGSDHFGIPLHEYRVPLDKHGHLVVDETTGLITWERVLSTARPASGDPDYVQNVLKEPLY
jgi:hypothetical protein